MIKKIRIFLKRCFLICLLMGLVGYYAYFLTTDSRFEKMGRIHNRELSEVSGIVKSHINPNVIWLHNDSGHSSRIYAFSTKGDYLRTYELEGIQLIDFEDITRIDYQDESYLLLCDLGGNTKIGAKSPAQMILIKEPNITDCQSQTVEFLSDYTRIDLNFDHIDFKPNIEAAAYNSKAESVYLFTKTLFTNAINSSVYSVDLSKILRQMTSKEEESHQTTAGENIEDSSQLAEGVLAEKERSMMSDNYDETLSNEQLQDIYKLKANWVTDINFKALQDLKWVDFRHLILRIFDFPSAVTAADFSDDGRQLLIRTYGNAFYYKIDLNDESSEIDTNNKMVQIDKAQIDHVLTYEKPYYLRTPFEAIGESIAFDQTGQGFYLTSEGYFQNIYHVNIQNSVMD